MCPENKVHVEGIITSDESRSSSLTGSSRLTKTLLYYTVLLQYFLFFHYSAAFVTKVEKVT